MSARIRVVAAILLAVLLAASCGGDDSDSGAPAGSSSGTDSQSSVSDTTDDGGEADPTATLRLSQNIAPGQWDPHNGRSAVVDGSIMGPVYDRLLRITGDLEIEPQLATSYEMATDNLSMTMALRDDVTFHDGTPFNADAVKANVDYAKSTAGFGASQLTIVDSVTVVSPTSVKFNFNANGSTFPIIVAYHIAVGGMVSPAALANPASLATTPSGSGPYELTEQTQDRTVYTKVDDYWDDEVAARAPAKIELITITDDNARLAALRSGQVDGMTVINPFPNLQEITSSGIELYEANPNVRLALVAFNFTNPALADPKVRLALNMALDRGAIAKSVFADACVPTSVPFPKGTLGYDEDSPEIEYDPEGAKRLLQEAGATDLKLRMVHIVQPLFQNQATVVQAQFAEVGVEVELVGIPAAQSQPEWRSGNYDAFVSSQSGLPDPSLVLFDNFIKTNMPGGSDPELEKKWTAMRELALDSDERTEALEDIAAYESETPTNAVICAHTPQLLYNAKVGGVDDQTFNRTSSAWETRKLFVKKNP